MATKLKKMGGTICDCCRNIVLDTDTSCGHCGCPFKSDGPLSPSNTTSNLPQSVVKYYGLP